MPIPSNSSEKTKSKSEQNDNDINTTNKNDGLSTENTNTDYNGNHITVPTCLCRRNDKTLIGTYLEIYLKTEEIVSCNIFGTDSDTYTCTSLRAMKTLNVALITIPSVVLALLFVIIYFLFALNGLYQIISYTSHRPKKRTKLVYQDLKKWLIREYAYNFLKEMRKEKIANFSLKRYHNSCQLYDVRLSFNSSYTLFPANTLTEYYKEIEYCPEMSFRERMQFDMFRTSTFSEFPRNSPVSTLMLAKAGFYYEGHGDEVICFKCGIRYRNWQTLDDPIQIHRAISPSCSFVSEFGSNSSENAPPNELNDANQGSILYRREHENNHNDVSSPQNTFIEQASSSRDSRNPIEISRNNDTERIRSLPLQIGSQNTETTNSSADSSLPVVSDSHENRPETSVTQNEHMTQNSESMREFFLNSTVSTETRQSRIHHERSHRSPVQQNSNSINEDAPIYEDNNNPEDSLSQPSNHPTSSTVSAPVDNDRPMSAAATLEPLGISTEKPKYPQYAVLATRIASFRNWPEHLHQKPEDLAKAGFLYEGTHDFTRCFFCGGGLRDWEPQDDPLIEHARWYKKCVFVRQCQGEDFVNLVQQGKIQEAMDKVIFENHDTFKSDLNGRKRKSEEEQRQIDEILTSPAVQSVREMGYSQENVRLAVQILKRNNAQITADSLLQCVLEIEEGDSNSREPSEEGTRHKDNESKSNTISLETTCERKLEDETETLLAENRQLKEQQICKICMDEDISIVFLPCGHMATCVNCAPAVRKCPLCRRFIKGTVKAIMS